MRRRRLPRILLNAATVTSLVLGFTALLGWPLSYAYTLAVLVARPIEPDSSRVFCLMSDRGGLYFYVNTVDMDRPQPGWHGFAQWCEGAPPEFDLLGQPVNRWLPIQVFRGPQVDAHALLIVLPHWPVAMGGGTLVALITLARWRRRRSGGGHDLCPGCGYDLRATPARCPECGTVPPPPSA